MRHYADCKERGGAPTLESAITGLYQRTGAWDPRLGDRPPREPQAGDPTGGEVLIVVGTGRAPYKMPRREPLGLGVAYLSSPTCAPHCLSPAQRAQARELSAKGLTTWLNFPEMHQVQAQVTAVAAEIDGAPARGGAAMDVEAHVMKAFERSKGMLLLAAFTRTVTRALAGAGAEAIVRAAAGEDGGGALGFLAGVLVEGTMVAADVPDTRSWTSLPSHIHLFRSRVPAGRRSLRIVLTGRISGEVIREIDVSEGGGVVVPYLTLR